MTLAMGDTMGTTNVIKEIFEKMEYGLELENTSAVADWLKSKRNHIHAYVDKKDEQPSGETFSLKNANTEEKLCDIHVPESTTVELILKKLSEEKNTWNEIDPVKRAEIIFKLGAEIQKKQNIFMQFEVAARGILSKDTKNKALPLLTDYLQYYSSFSVKHKTENPSWAPKGLVVAILPDTNSLWSLGSVLGPSLAAGYRVVLQTGPELSLTANFLVELAEQSGVPENTIRILPGKIDPNIFLTHPGVSIISIFDDIYKEEYLIANPFNKKILHFNSSGTSMLVFENGDLDSACHCFVDAAWGYKGMLSWSVKNVFVQENVYDKFVHKLKHKLVQTKVDKGNKKNADISYPDDKTQDKMAKMIQKAESEGVEIYQPNTNSSIPIVFIGSNIFPNNVIKEDFLNVPIVTVVPFRTINEAVALSNNTRRGLGVAVWTESTSLVNELIGKLKVGNIWVNSHGLFAANIPNSPHKTSGNAFLGGNEGFYEYVITKSAKNENISQLKNTEIMEKVISEAKKAQDGWSKLNRLEKTKSLQIIAQNIQAKKNSWGLPEKWVEDWINTIYECVSNTTEETFAKYKHFNVIATWEPCGVVAIETSEDKDFHNKRLMVAALVEGNAVILLNRCKEASDFYEFVSKLLTKGVLSTIPHSQDAVKVAALHKELNVYVGESNNVFCTLPLQTSNKFKVANGRSWGEVRTKVSLAKNVWLNKGQSFI